MELSKADYEALAAFRYRLRRFLRHAEEGARAAGITPQQHQLLLAMKGHPGREWASVSELAEALQVQHHAAVGLVNRCERAGLVQRTPDPEDGRQLRIVLTEQGDARLREVSLGNRNELARLRQALQVSFLDDA
jgi:DNA-binding MarR family transcriptional regulator